MEELREMINKKVEYLLSLNTKDKSVIGQLLGLRCVLEYMDELEKPKDIQRRR